MNSLERDRTVRLANSPDFLKLAEYLSLMLSLVGAIVATVTHQIAYGVVPFSISLCLSVLNRQRFEESVRQILRATAEQQLAYLDRKCAELEQKFSALPAEAQLSDRLGEEESAQIETDTPSAGDRETRLDDFLDFFDLDPDEEEI